MDNEVQPPGPKAIAQSQQVHQRIDGTFLGAADNGHHGVHRLAALQTAFQGGFQGRHVRAGIAIGGKVDNAGRPKP